MGVKGYRANIKEPDKEVGFNTLQLTPFIIDVLANDDWHNLRKQVKLEDGQLKGYGIPNGSGIVHYLDMSLEAVRYSCTEIVKGKLVMESIILPKK